MTETLKDKLKARRMGVVIESAATDPKKKMTDEQFDAYYAFVRKQLIDEGVPLVNTKWVQKPATKARLS
jgi:hypothetical protein